MPGSGSSVFQRNQFAQLNDRVSLIEDVLDHLLGQAQWGWGWPWPGPIVDPGPEDLGRTRGISSWRRPPIGDPAVYDLARLRELALQPEFANLKVADLLRRIRPQPGADPGPEDIVRFTLAELAEELHRVNAQKIRLESFEKMLTERVAELKKTAGKG